MVAKTKTESIKSGKNNVMDRLESIHLWLDEDDKVFSDYHRSLLDDLEPETAYERILANDIIALSWEIIRIRALRDNTFNRETALHLKSEFQVRVEERFDGPKEEFERTILNPKWSKERQRKIMLKHVGMTETDLVAAAYEGPYGSGRLKDKIGQLDQKIADLESRRRRLVTDYELMCKKNYNRKNKG